MPPSTEALVMALRLFFRLMTDGEVPVTERELFRAYQDPEVRAIIQDVIEPEAKVKLFATDAALYLAPDLDNDLFGHRNDELRDAMGLKNNTELHAAYFVLLCLLASFYNSDDQRLASRAFLSVEALEGLVSDHLGSVLAADEAAVQQMEQDTELSLQAIARFWDGLDIYDDQLKQLLRARNNRVSFILRVCRFLEKEGLVSVLEQREIRLLPKLQQIVLHYYGHEQRKDRLLRLLQAPLPLETSHAQD